MQMIPRGAMRAGDTDLPPHYLSTVDGRVCIYCGGSWRLQPDEPTYKAGDRLILVGDGTSVAEAYQAWVDLLGLPVLVFESERRNGWVHLAFEKVPV